MVARNAARKMPGVLTYDNGSISLEVFDFLRYQATEEPREGDAGVRREPIILGSGEGQDYTLYQIRQIGRRLHAPVNNVEWRYSAHYLLVGAHFESEAALCFPPLHSAFLNSQTGWGRQRSVRSYYAPKRRRTLSRWFTTFLSLSRFLFQQSTQRYGAIVGPLWSRQAIQ